jgi:hypothetical protein
VPGDGRAWRQHLSRRVRADSRHNVRRVNAACSRCSSIISVSSVVAASSVPRVRTASLAFDSTTNRLTMTYTGVTVRPKPVTTTPPQRATGLLHSLSDHMLPRPHMRLRATLCILCMNCIKVHSNLSGPSLSAPQSDADVSYQRTRRRDRGADY